ncbi:hypothetical protein HY633_04305 [Candidatus Uhrbacteria bacterium]|nr:hypothetical protein [Candidatus Uhrbacteria bacterium]
MDFFRPNTPAAAFGAAHVSRGEPVADKLARIAGRAFDLFEWSLEKLFDILIPVLIVIVLPFVCLFTVFVDTLFFPVRGEFRIPDEASASAGKADRKRRRRHPS